MGKLSILLSTIFFYSAFHFMGLGQEPSLSRPNIILIVADDLGYGDVGCYGQQKIATPNIDRLAANGIRFTQFYAGTSVCAPSRASLMTGLHTGHTPVRGNKGTKPEGQSPLPASTVTFASHLQHQGYSTHAFGKWGLGFITTTGDPLKQGFNEFYGYNCQTLAHNYYPDHLWHNYDSISLAGNLKSDSVYSGDLIHQQAMKFLKAGHNRPFLLYLPYTLPHADVVVPHDSTYNYYVHKFNEKPVQLKQSNDGEKHHFDEYTHAAFAAMVSRLDRYVGEIADVVRRRGIAENTLIIFTSDNGPHKENGGDPEFFKSSAGLRGIKRDLYEGGIRVPFIAYWPGKIKPSISQEAGTFWDLYPTFQQLSGSPVSKNIDGFSLVPAFTGMAQPHHKYLYWEFHESGGRQAVRLGDWKGVKLNVTAKPNSPLELYNLRTDPAEKTDIASRYPAVVTQIEAILKQAHVENKEWPLLWSEQKK